MLTHFLIGAALGAVTGMPIGVVGAAIIDAAYRHPLRRAVGVGIGGGTGDMACAAFGILGIGPVLASSPHVPPVLYAVSGVALIAYGVQTMRGPRLRPQASPRGAHSPVGSRACRHGFAIGVGLVLANPASLVTWVVIVGGALGAAAWPEALAAVIGVGIGSAIWFVILAHIARRGARVLGEQMIWIARAAGALLMAYGLFSLARGARYWIIHA